jgi:hypothetical protein
MKWGQMMNKKLLLSSVLFFSLASSQAAQEASITHDIQVVPQGYRDTVFLNSKEVENIIHTLVPRSKASSESPKNNNQCDYDVHVVPDLTLQWTQDEDYIGSSAWHEYDSNQAKTQQALIAENRADQKYWNAFFDRIVKETAIVESFFSYWEQQGYSIDYMEFVNRYREAMEEQKENIDCICTIKDFQVKSRYSLKNIHLLKVKINTILQELTFYSGLYEEDSTDDEMETEDE